MSRSKDDKEKYGTIKDILENVDPMEAAIMILGGTAASCGITPPMTRLLLIFSGGNSSTNNVVKEDLTGAFLRSANGIVGSIWDIISQPFGGLFGKLGTTSDSTPAPTQGSVEANQAKLGLFCSGSIEAMIMYKLVSNPETFKALLQLPGQVLTGAEGLAKVIPAIV